VCFPGRESRPADFGRFLLWTTPGNAVGGSFFVGFIKHNYANKTIQAA
jgi:formate/nitrite transporter FocA (FNT family)